jgi:hypothetical protein
VTGGFTLKERLIARFMPVMLRYTAFKLLHDLWQQPEHTRNTYRTGKRLSLPARLLAPAFRRTIDERPVPS